MSRKDHSKTEQIRFEHFRFYDYTGIARHLESMAEKGWLLKECGRVFWRYEAIPPQKIHFAVTYRPELSDFDPLPDRNRELYRELCESAGWTRIASRQSMQIFCSRDSKPVPLETDPVTQLDAISQTMRKNLYPGWILLIFLCCLQFVQVPSRIIRNPVSFFSSPLNTMIPLLYLFLLLAIIAEMIPYFLWKKKSEAAVAAGADTLPDSRAGQGRFLSIAALLLSALCLIPVFLFQPEVTSSGVLLALAVIAIVVFLVNGIRQHLQETGASRKKNMMITGASAVFLTLGFLAVSTLLILGFVIYDAPYASEKEESNWVPASDGFLYYWDMKQDELLLTAEDLTDTGGYPYYSYENRHQATPLLAYSEMSQLAPPVQRETPPELEYDVVDVKWDALYEMCLGHFLDDQRMAYLEQTWQSADASDWSCSSAWRRYSRNEPDSTWLLSGRDPQSGRQRIVKITFYWEPTKAQIVRAGEKLFG
ncbi:MAG: DUF2812 domain-containing protein [Firmicutes bacterium]|nr:DUF2812 domain-containing protein [Bacillota bacterium]MDY5855769.1 DUF2812 domain-containing protein [Anaerovoracaceae bacterium]